MKTPRKALTLAACLILAGTACQVALADQIYYARPATCEPGYTIVEEICYREVVHQICKVVPDVKKVKKWVYSTKDDPFCLPRLPPLGGHHCHCGTCPECKRCSEPLLRKLLVKREIICEVPITKCVIETVVKKEPYSIYRKVPCAPASGILSPPTGHAPVPMPATGNNKK